MSRKRQDFLNKVFDKLTKSFNSFSLKCVIIALIVVQLVQPITAVTKVLYEIHLTETAGFERHEIGVLENFGTPEQQLVVKGNRTNENLGAGEKFYVEEVNYIADNKGYRSKVRVYERPLSGNRIGAVGLKSAVG